MQVELKKTTQQRQKKLDNGQLLAQKNSFSTCRTTSSGSTFFLLLDASQTCGLLLPNVLFQGSPSCSNAQQVLTRLASKGLESVNKNGLVQTFPCLVSTTSMDFSFVSSFCYGFQTSVSQANLQSARRGQRLFRLKKRNKKPIQEIEEKEVRWTNEQKHHGQTYSFFFFHKNRKATCLFNNVSFNGDFHVCRVETVYALEGLVSCQNAFLVKGSNSLQASTFLLGRMFSLVWGYGFRLQHGGKKCLKHRKDNERKIHINANAIRNEQDFAKDAI